MSPLFSFYLGEQDREHGKHKYFPNPLPAPRLSDGLDLFCKLDCLIEALLALRGEPLSKMVELNDEIVEKTNPSLEDLGSNQLLINYKVYQSYFLPKNWVEMINGLLGYFLELQKQLVDGNTDGHLSQAVELTTSSGTPSKFTLQINVIELTAEVLSLKGKIRDLEKKIFNLRSEIKKREVKPKPKPGFHDQVSGMRQNHQQVQIADVVSMALSLLSNRPQERTARNKPKQKRQPKR